MKAILLFGMFFSFLLSSFSFQKASAQTFSAKTDFPAGTEPRNLIITDFNGDGKPDLAISNLSGVSIYFNTTPAGNTLPSFSTAVDFILGSNLGDLGSADLNGDGKIDLAVANNHGRCVSVILNTTTPGASTPTFSPQTDFPTDSNSGSITLNDFNGDGKTDLAATNHITNKLAIFLNTTTIGSFTPAFSSRVDLNTGLAPVSNATADFNKDGKQDIATANVNSGSVSIFLNTTTTGALTPAFSTRTDLSVSSNISSVSTADLNCDGKPDVICSNVITNSVAVFLNTTIPGATTLSFSSKTEFTVGLTPQAVTVVDLNGDGKPDFTSANYSSGSISVLLNNTTSGASTPTFTSKTDFSAGLGTASVSVGDLNGDGKPDIVAGNFSAGTISVLFNTTHMGETPVFSSRTDFTAEPNSSSIAAEDLNGDGKIDFVIGPRNLDSLSVYLNTTGLGDATPSFTAKKNFSTYGSVSVSIKDFNGDGKPDLASASAYSSYVSILLNTTAPGSLTPTFSENIYFEVSSYSNFISSGDFNGDGKQDLAVAGMYSVSVLLNTTAPGASAPSFSPYSEFAATSSTEAISVADFNGDGIPDLGLAGGGSASFFILLNTTTPGASTPTFSVRTDFSTGGGCYSISTGDLNGDRKPDVVTCHPHYVAVFFNTTAPGASTPDFTPAEDFFTGMSSAPNSIGIKDINGDGKLDLAVACVYTNAISVFINTTIPGALTPSFTAKIDFLTNSQPMSVSISDFNNDSKQDFISANYSGTASVLLNTVIFLLPVELSSFDVSVEGQNVILQWNTITEENNSGFEVQRSSAGRGWTKIGFINGRGTTNILQNYWFADNKLSSDTYRYRLKQIDFNGNFKYYDLQSEVVVGIPNKFILNQNYPNPFNPNTVISYQLPSAGFISLKIYDITGREVKQLVNEIQQAGYYTVNFNAAGLSSGMYFYKLSAGNFNEVKKMVVIK
jgi:hypothetical protein